MINIKFNYYYYIAILETICVQIKLLVLHSSTWSHLTLRK